MSYLDKYKVGSPLFRTLSEGRMQWNALQNRLRFKHPSPEGVITAEELEKTANNQVQLKKLSATYSHPVSDSNIIPAEARSLLNKTTPINFPESFVLNIANGSVLGDGSVLVENHLLSDCTTDFHRKPEHHQLLSAGRIPKPVPFNGRLAVVASPGSSNYFHWTLDSIPRLSLLKGIDDQIDGYYLDNGSGFHQDWIKLLGLPEDKIICPAPDSHLIAKELIVPSFAGLPGLPSAEGIDFVRSFMPVSSKKGKRIYISRSGARRRRILNEKELLPILSKYGFETVLPGELSIKEQMELFSSADVIVSPHGAELTNLAYCRPETQVIELFSPYYVNPCFRQLASVCRLKHTALIGRGGERLLHKGTDAHYVWANMRVDVGQLEKALSDLNE